MECTSRTSSRLRLSWCLVVLVGVVLMLASSPGSAAAAAPRRLLQTCIGQDFDVPHAHLRAKNNVRPLKYTQELSDRAAAWVAQFKDNCAAAAPAPGINVFLGPTGAQPNEAVTEWSKEEEHFDYGSNTCADGKGCERYTQMVWRNSKEFGCATVDCTSGGTLMACHYEPQGNVMGQKPF